MQRKVAKKTQNDRSCGSDRKSKNDNKEPSESGDKTEDQPSEAGDQSDQEDDAINDGKESSKAKMTGHKDTEVIKDKNQKQSIRSQAQKSTAK